MPPGLEVLFEGTNLARLLHGLWVSCYIALAAMGLSLMAGVPLGIVMTSHRRSVKVLTKAYLEAVRVLPQLVLLFVFYFYLTVVARVEISGQLAAVIVFALWGTAELADLVRGAIVSLPAHQLESARALGLTRFQVQAHVVLPLSARRLAPSAVNLFTRMVKTTSLVVLIGVVEVLKVAQQIIDANRFNAPDAALWIYAVVFGLYFALCYPISRLAKSLEARWP